MKDGAEFLKYVTERVVSRWETAGTPEDRRTRRQRREPWVTRWFGQLLPVGIGIWWSRRKAVVRFLQAKQSGSRTDRQADYS